MPAKDADAQKIESLRTKRKPDVSDLVELLKAYVKQETVGPLKGAGRWMGFGAAGAFLFGIAIVMVVLGVLRLVQTEWPEVFDGSWSWVPYVFALILCVGAMVLAISRIRKTTLAKEPS